MYLHIDCNSFYASVEVSLHPDLVGKPVVVASNNEAGGGIILALTREAKALGLKRGVPLFQVKEVLERHDVAIFPANLQKYVDVSRRLMQVVKEQDIVLNMQKYSIDEFFGELPLTNPALLREYAQKVKCHIEKCTGIPVSCGIASTFTLAKIATWYSKHYPAYEGVCVLPDDKIEVALGRLPIEDVWGIGRRTAPMMRVVGIRTALDFYHMEGSIVKRQYKITGHRTWLELHGKPCIEIDSPARQQSIMHSRTFTHMVTELDQLRSLVSGYASDAARKLRDQHGVCLEVGAFVATNPHRQDLAQYSESSSVRLAVATSDTQQIAQAALKCLEGIFRPGFHYKRAGVWLSDITSDEAIQQDLFATPRHSRQKQRHLMATIDSLNDRYGMNRVSLAIQQPQPQPESVKGMRPFKSETTCIDDILEVH